MFKLLKVKYKHQLINIMLQSTLLGTFSVNIVTPFLLSTIFYRYIAEFYIYLWLLLNISLFICRVLFIRYALFENKKVNGDVNKILYILYILLFLSAMLHATALFYISIQPNIPEIYLFFMAIITIALVAGSSATLGSVVSTFYIYVTANILPMIFIFMYHGGELYYFFSLAATLFMFVNLKSGSLQYKLLNENIELKESFESRVKESAREIKDKEKLLQRQSRLVQMGEMLSMIAHQWRQPLSAISSSSSSIHLRAQLDKLDTQYVLDITDNISEYAQHLSETINDFRSFFQPNKEKNETSFSEMLDSVLKIISVSITNKNIQLITSLNCDEHFFSYSNELKQVILNLIKNAEDVLVERQIKNAYIKISTTKENNSLIMQVSDNGGGIEEKLQEKVFTPYFSTKKQKDGTGLGLYMSKIIVEEHCGGSLKIFNDAFGAVFQITLNAKQVVK